jgi:hypothetical protein
VRGGGKGGEGVVEGRMGASAVKRRRSGLGLESHATSQESLVHRWNGRGLREVARPDKEPNGASRPEVAAPLPPFRPTRARTPRPQLPPARVRAAAARTPSLLTLLPRETVDNRLAALASLLELPSADAAADAAAKAPAVLIEPPGMVEAQLGHLGAILAVRPTEAAALAAAQPGLLLLPPQVMRTRLEALAATLKVRGARRGGRGPVLGGGANAGLPHTNARHWLYDARPLHPFGAVARLTVCAADMHQPVSALFLWPGRCRGRAHSGGQAPRAADSVHISAAQGRPGGGRALREAWDVGVGPGRPRAVISLALRL